MQFNTNQLELLIDQMWLQYDLATDEHDREFYQMKALEYLSRYNFLIKLEVAA